MGVDLSTTELRWLNNEVRSLRGAPTAIGHCGADLLLIGVPVYMRLRSGVEVEGENMQDLLIHPEGLTRFYSIGDPNIDCPFLYAAEIQLREDGSSHWFIIEVVRGSNAVSLESAIGDSNLAPFLKELTARFGTGQLELPPARSRQSTGVLWPPELIPQLGLLGAVAWQLGTMRRGVRFSILMGHTFKMNGLATRVQMKMVYLVLNLRTYFLQIRYHTEVIWYLHARKLTYSNMKMDHLKM